MNLLNILNHEIEKSGGIGKLYEKASLELKQFEEDKKPNLKIYSREICKIMDIKTGEIFNNAAQAARSIKANIRIFQNNIKKNGTYKTFVKVA